MSRILNAARELVNCAIPALTIVYVAGLSYLILAPDPWWIFGSPGRSAEQTVDMTLADYVQHTIVFAVLGVLLAANSRRKREENRDRYLLPARPTGCFAQKAPVPFFFCGLCYAVGTECLQYRIPPRTCSAVDGIANVLGLTAGWFLFLGLLEMLDRVVSLCGTPRIQD